MVSSNSDFSRAHSQLEVNLPDISRTIREQSVLIFLVAAIVILISVAYAFLSAPTYRASSLVMPPRQSDIVAYNYGRREAGLEELKVSDVYSVFIRNLQSGALMQEFFTQVYLPYLGDKAKGIPKGELEKRFQKVLAIGNPDLKNRPERFVITAELTEPDVAAEWVSKFITMAAERSVEEMKRNVLSQVKNREASLESTVQVLKNAAALEKDDRIVRLQEALRIAGELGLNQPQVLAGRASPDSGLAALVEGDLMYLRGTKALQAELAALQHRKSDEAFIPGLRALQRSLDYLKVIAVAPRDVRVYTQDGVADVPDTPIKPRKGLIIGLGTVLGLILGLAFGLIQSTRAAKKKIN